MPRCGQVLRKPRITPSAPRTTKTECSPIDVLDEVAGIGHLLDAAGDLPHVRPQPLVLEGQELGRREALAGDGVGPEGHQVSTAALQTIDPALVWMVWPVTWRLRGQAEEHDDGSDVLGP